MLGRWSDVPLRCASYMFGTYKENERAVLAVVVGLTRAEMDPNVQTSRISIVYSKWDIAI